MLDHAETDLSTKIMLSGDGFAEHLVINNLYKKLSEKKKLKTICPSPFSEEELDAVYTDKYVFKTSGTYDISINLFDLCPNNLHYEQEKKIYQELLDLSTNEFQKASENHFKLEAIYNEAMDYSYNDRIYGYLLKEIDTIFS